MLIKLNRRVIAVVGVLLLGAFILVEAIRTAPIRASVTTLSRLVAASNRGDLEAVELLCSESILRAGVIRAAPEGGMIGLPRTIDKNFRAWKQGSVVLIRPTGRGGLAYRFISEADRWVFDGLATEVSQVSRGR